MRKTLLIAAFGAALGAGLSSAYYHFVYEPPRVVGAYQVVTGPHGTYRINTFNGWTDMLREDPLPLLPKWKAIYPNY
jgi:hypothetical protein